MAEIVNEIVSDIAVTVLEELGSRFFQELSSALGVERDLKKLESTVKAIDAVLFDAEQTQASDKRLRTWLGELKDVLRDAEKVLYEVKRRDLLNKVMKRFGSTSEKVCYFLLGSNPFVFHIKMAQKIKHIRKRLDDIAADQSRFNLAERLED